MTKGVTILPKVSVSGTVDVGNTVTTDFVGPAEVYKSGLKTPAPGVQEVMIDLQPAQDIKVRRIEFSSRAYGTFVATVNGVEFARGKTTPEAPDLAKDLINWQDVGPTDDLKLVFDQPNGPVTDAEARIYYTL